MSQHAEEKMVCPNCGFPATHNYCAQCGQQNHLHKETFFGLIVHFVAHYFHYDSKFWQTLKALITKPGRLTIAYWEKKRNRYIPPISLYIFVSVVYFFMHFTFSNGTLSEYIKGNSKESTSQNSAKEVTLAEMELGQGNVGARDSSSSRMLKGVNLDSTVKNAMAKAGADTADARQGWTVTNDMFLHALEKTEHSIPKILFFMIPVMALMLKVLFARRKETYFVDHSIFSLHVHAFAFTMLLLSVCEVPEEAKNWFLRVIRFLQGLTMLAILFYLVVALRNVYKIRWFRASIYGLLIFVGYFVMFFIVATVYLLYLLYLQQPG